MRNKLIVIVVALLAVALVAIALKMQDSGRVADLETRSLLSEEQLAILSELDRIQLSRGDGEVELVRDGGRWGVASRSLYPAHSERVAALLHAVRGARIVEQQTANPQHHERLGLAADDHDSLTVRLQSGERGFGLIYGNSVGSGQLLRFADDDQVWLINRPFSMTVNSVDWLALDVIRIPMEQVASARWQHADGEVLELDKAEEGDYNFRLVDLEAAQQAGNERWINSMVLALLSFSAQDVALRSDLALAEPLLNMQINTWAGAELQASLHDINGRYWLLIDHFEQPQDGTLAVNADERWAFQLNLGQVESLNKRHADIVRSVATESGSEGN